MSVRLDIERIITDALRTYLQSAIDPNLQGDCPVVGFWDDMDVDEASRFVVHMPTGSVDEEHQPGTFQVRVDITVKSRWAQATIAEDWEAHGNRVNACRNALWDDGMQSALETIVAGTIGFNYVHPDREIQTENRDQYFHTPTTLRIGVFTVDQT